MARNLNAQERVPSPRMKPKRSKYDTNPLDQDVADRATESFSSNESGSQTQPVGQVSFGKLLRT